jgi:hypothetical protein
MQTATTGVVRCLFFVETAGPKHLELESHSVASPNKANGIGFGLLRTEQKKSAECHPGPCGTSTPP